MSPNLCGVARYTEQSGEAGVTFRCSGQPPYFLTHEQALSLAAWIVAVVDPTRVEFLPALDSIVNMSGEGTTSDLPAPSWDPIEDAKTGLRPPSKGFR